MSFSNHNVYGEVKVVDATETSSYPTAATLMSVITVAKIKPMSKITKRQQGDLFAGRPTG
jgi:hypothetical protein